MNYGKANRNFGSKANLLQANILGNFFAQSLQSTQ